MTGLDVEDIVLNYDPEHPQQRFLSAGLEAALMSATGRLPSHSSVARGIKTDRRAAGSCAGGDG
jgi:hypothetical protein